MNTSTSFHRGIRSCWICLWLATLLAAVPGRVHGAVEDVVVVFKTHFDIGYTDMATNVVQRYRTTMIDEALSVVDQNRDLPANQQFVWTLPGWPMTRILEDWPGQTAERQRRVREAFQEGRFAVHALPFTTHTELLEPEDLVRGLAYATRLTHDAGIPAPRDAKMTDVPSHSWILPTLLRAAGIEFLHLGCNPASRSPEVPQLFWWEGPDGSRLLTMYSAEDYGTGLVPPPDWPHRTWLALIHTGDNHGPPRPDEVRQVLEQARAKLPGVRVRIGRLSDFSDAILAEASDIPVVRGDMPDTWIHGPMSDPQGAALARRIRPRIAMVEALDTHLPLWGVDPPPVRDVIAKAYDQSLLYGEHTWGGAYWWIYGSYRAEYGEAWQAERAAGRFDRIEASWAEHTAYIENAARLIDPLLEQQLTTLAQTVAEDRDRILLFNPLPWLRSPGVATARVTDARFKLEIGPGSGVSPARIYELGGSRSFGLLGNPDFNAFYDVHEDEIRLLVPPIPPSGYQVLTHQGALVNHMHMARTDPNEARLAAGRFRARLDPTQGTIAALRVAGQMTPGGATVPAVAEVVDLNSPYGFGQVLYERFDSNQVAAFVSSYVKSTAHWATNELGKPMLPPASVSPSQAVSPTNFTATYRSSFFAAEAILTAQASEAVPFGVTTHYLFYNDLPWFDIEVTLHKKPADPWPEAAWICLPFELENPQFRLGRLGGIVDPTRDLVPGSNHHLHAIHTGVAVFDRTGRGFGVCPIDSPLVSLGEPGGWKYSADFIPGKATIFINLFNNQWTTNFRLWNEGTWTSRVRIWSFHQYDPVESLVRPALEARYPVQAVCATGKGGSIPTTGQGIALRHSDRTDAVAPPFSPRRKNVLVTAFGRSPHNPGILLRLWELAGEDGDCVVDLPKAMAVDRAVPVNLRDEAIGPAVTVTGHRFIAPLKGFAPASYLLLPPSPDPDSTEKGGKGAGPAIRICVAIH
jgi:alpha-mannosidase